MSELYDEMVEEFEFFTKACFPEHTFDKENITVTDGSEESYQGRYDVSDTAMVFAEVQSIHSDNRWYLDAAEEKYSDEEYAEMIIHHYSEGLEEFKKLYGDEWKKIALECQFENGGF